MPEQALFPEHGRSHLSGAAPFLGGEAQQLPEHGLHGQAHEHGPSEGEPVLRMGQQLQIMAQGLAETDAGIQHDVLFRQTGGGQTVQLALEKGHDLGTHVRIAGILLHDVRSALAVHEHITRLVLDKHVQQAGIEAAGRNVVDDLHAFFKHGSRRGRMVGVHG